LNASAVKNRVRSKKLPVKHPVAKSPMGVMVTPRLLTNLTRVFKQLADESRLKILLALAQEGELHVSALCELLHQTQPAVSHHLTLLRMTGLVGFRRQGKHNFYHVESGFLCELFEQFFHDVGCDDQNLQFKDFSIIYRRG
jgi:ArsR family transcriptional regulator